MDKGHGGDGTGKMEEHTLIFYTNKFIPASSAACARGPVIFIRPEYRDDKGLEAHEQVHVRQWWRTLGLHSLLYLVSKRYRLNAEVEAYREQLRYPPASADPDGYREKYAGWLAAPGWVEGYDLQRVVSQEEAIALLS